MIQLMQHQQRGVELAREHLRFGFGHDPGTGKTVLILAVVDDAKRRGFTGKTLVVAPLSILDAAWANDAKHFPQLKAVVCWHTSRTRRLKLIATPDADVLVTNFEQFKAHVDDFLAAGVTRLVIDESSKVKSCRALPGGESQITRAAVAFADRMESVYCLSGTPAPNTELEYFSQLRCIDKGLFGWNSWQFASRYFKPVKRQVGVRMKDEFRDTFRRNGVSLPRNLEVMRHPDAMKVLREAQIPADHKELYFEPVEKTVGFEMREEARAEFLEKLRSRWWALKATECLDLPEETDVVREVQLDLGEKSAYATMLEQLRVEVGDGEDAVRIDATSNGKLAKLQQITGGGLYDADGEYAPIGRSKIEALLELVEEIGDRPMVIWAQHTAEINGIVAQLAELKKTVAKIDGSVPMAKRTSVVRDFQAGTLQFIVAHAQAAGHGLTLTAARYDCFFSLGWIPEHHDQARKRIHRTGQRWPVTHYYLIAPRTVDERVLEVLRRKRTASNAIKELLKMSAEPAGVGDAN